MKIACISDVHAKLEEDSYVLLNKFFNQKDTISSDKIFLLGDIFDLMVGEFSQYTSRYEEYFKNIKECLDRGQEVYVFEGNHDFHLEQVYYDYDKRIKYIKSNLRLSLNGKSYLFNHGDIVDVDNKAYERWKKIYSSKPFGFFLKYIIPYRLVLSLGDKASNNSRNRGKKTFNKEQFREKYRNGAMKIMKELDVDVLVCGHTHIQENYKKDAKNYINIGYPNESKEFLLISDVAEEFRLII